MDGVNGAQSGRPTATLTAAQILQRLSFTRVLTTPADPDPDQDSPLRRAILAGLLDAAVRGSAVASLWVRPKAWEPLHVLISGGLKSSRTEPDTGRGDPLLFPLGATGIAVPDDDVRSLLAPFACWIACTGGMEPLLRDSEEQTAKAEYRWSASTLDDVVGYLSDQAFAWLVLCTPRPNKVVHAELDTLRREILRLRQSGDRSESDVIDLERRQGWFRELSRVGIGGVWDVSIVVGTPDEVSALPMASVLSSAAEHSVSLYKIRPIPDSVASSLDGALEARRSSGSRSTEDLPFRATSDLVAALIRPPETELPGLRVVTPPSFDTTPERSGDGHDDIELGAVLDRFLRPAGPLTISLSTLNRHTFVCGATGAGKSQTVRSLLESLSRRPKPIPWLVIEPAKAEYARMAGRVQDSPAADVLVIAPGDLRAPPGSLNPLEPASLEPGNPERTFPLQSHADLVRALFLAAFQAEEPFPQVLSRALIECYEEAGWDLVTGEPLLTWDVASGQPPLSSAEGSRCAPRYPALGNLQRIARDVVDEIGYDEDIKKRVRGFVDVRIGSLRLGTPGRFFEGGHPLDFAALLRRNVVLEAESITNDQDKAFVMGAVLIRLYEQLLLEEKERFARERTPNPFRHVTVIEEAHRLLRNVGAESPAAHALELFASLLAEVRAYGEGIIVAEQIPSKLITDVIKNSALKVMHRLPAADDREAVGATMNLSTAQSEYVVTLEPGTAAVFADGMDRPLLVQMHAGEAREDSEKATRLPPLVAGGRRSRGCGEQCTNGEPCNLLTMRHAERLLQNHPELTMWIEASCAAHCQGFPSPGLVETRTVQELRRPGGEDRRLVECALAHAVEQAIGARYQGLKHFYDPDALGEHLADAATVALFGEGSAAACADDRGRWRAGGRRFEDIAKWLGAPASKGPRAHPQADAVRSAQERGLELGEGTPADQLSYLNSLEWLHYVDEQQLSLLVGNTHAPLVRRAAAKLAGPGTLREQMKKALGALTWGDPVLADNLLRVMTTVPSKEPGAGGPSS